MYTLAIASMVMMTLRKFLTLIRKQLGCSIPKRDNQGGIKSQTAHHIIPDMVNRLSYMFTRDELKRREEQMRQKCSMSPLLNYEFFCSCGMCYFCRLSSSGDGISVSSRAGAHKGATKMFVSLNNMRSCSRLPNWEHGWYERKKWKELPC